MKQLRQTAAARRLSPEPGAQDGVQHSGGSLHADVIAPSCSGFIALLASFRSTGGTAPAEIVGRLLDEHPGANAVSLARRIDTGQVFGFGWCSILWLPMFQFDANDLAVKTSAQRVRAALPSLWSGWKVATWFAASDPRLGGRTPAEGLDADLEAVVRAAQSLESVDDFSPALLQRAHAVVAHA